MDYKVLFLQWLENDFLSYLAEWEESVATRSDMSLAERKKMCLSRETLEGLRLTGVFSMMCSTCTSVTHEPTCTSVTHEPFVYHITHSQIICGDGTISAEFSRCQVPP